MGILARDGNGAVLGTMVGAALATTYNASLSSSVAVTFNAATKHIEVAAIAKPILMRWGGSAASTSAFDAVIQPGETRRFHVPPSTTAANFIEQAASAALAVTEF